jgi:integrase
MAKDTAVRLELTERLLKSIDFTQQIIAGDGQEAQLSPTPAGNRDWIVRDTKVRGFAIRVYPGSEGHKANISFFVQRKMSKRSDEQGGLMSASVKRAFGQWPTMSLKDARDRAIAMIGLMVRGIDPAEEKRTNLKRIAASKAERDETFGVAFQNFCDKSEGVAESTKKDRKKVIAWMETSPLWTTPLVEVFPDAVAVSIDPLFKAATSKIKKPTWGPKKSDLSTAWKIHRYCSAAYSHAMAHKGKGVFLRGSSPFGVVQKEKKWPKPQPRTRVLEQDTPQGQEWLKTLVALREHKSPSSRVFADYLICAMVWGGRRREAQLLQWRDIDFERMQGHFRSENTKSKKDLFFPLTPWVAEILRARKQQNAEWGRDEEWVFPSRHHGKPISEHRSVLVELKEATGLWITAHDLRRTAASDTAGIGGSMLFVSMAMGHSGGAMAVTMGYIAKRVKLLRPIFETRERELRQHAGLVAPELKKGPVEALIEYLTDAKQDPTEREKLNKRAEHMLAMLMD